MNNCKYCDAELLENSTICPECGKDNAEEPVQVQSTEEIPADKEPVAEDPVQEAEKQKLSVGKSVLALISVILAIILLLAVVLNGRKAETADQGSVSETTAATIPADGNPDDVTCKGTYYADDEKVIAARDTVVATAGDLELTVSQLQVYYWMEVRNFLTQYGAYAAYFGLDMQQSLDTQVCNIGQTPMTWQQFFLDSAVRNWQRYASVSAASNVDGFVLPEDQQNSLTNLAEEMQAAALQNGIASADEMIHSSLGVAAELADYGVYMEQYFRAVGYYSLLSEAVTFTDEDVEAFFDAHAEDYAQAGLSKDSVLVNVRHILIYPEGADGTNIFTAEFGEEAWAAGETAAQAVLDEWLAGDMTEESFATLANAKSQDPGSNKNGGLYTDVNEGEMVQAFNDWCFDPARQVGDTGIVRTEYGFHVMYFSGSRPKWIDYASKDLVTDKVGAQINAIEEANPLTVHFENILLCNVELT